MGLVAANVKTIEKAARIIRDGGLVGMPTETVYGLAADATDGNAIARIFEAKGRPSFNPLICHFTSIADIQSHAHMDDRARALAQAFWPGPLTMILNRRSTSSIHDLVTAGLPTLAVRIPNHATARDLITAAGCPLAAPSANISGTLSPTSPAHVAASLGDKVDMILAAGTASVGLESTVIDLSTDTAAILRPGAITAEDIAAILGTEIPYATTSSDIKAPGMLLKHYAPDTPVRLNAIDVNPTEALLAFGSTTFMGVKGGGHAKDLPDTQIRNLSENGDLFEAAANLFAMLRDLDRPEHSAIAVMNIPNTSLGIAINDRLQRAASS